MIPNIAPRGTNVAGLLRYLFGPGRRDEHVNPRLVAAWSGAGPLHRLEPGTRADGHRDVRRLAGLLEQPVRAGRNPPALPVWHCSLRTHPSDRYLTDAQWAHIAGEVMAAAGLAPHRDTQAVRWVAIRHADDHVHLVATLVRQDRRTEWARNDRWRTQAACRDLEERYGLYRVAPTDRTAHVRPRSAEASKARRQGRTQTARADLRRGVRSAAASTGSLTEFQAVLQASGIRVRLRYSTTRPGEVSGYAVALPSHTTAAGDLVWYGGGRLAPDLTWPQLRRRWGTPTPRPRTPPRSRSQPPVQVYEQAAALIRATIDDIHTATTGGAGVDRADAAAYAAADVLTVVAGLVEGQRVGPLHRAAARMDRAARRPYRKPLPPARRAEELRSLARRLRLAGALVDDPGVFTVLRLVVELSLLAEALAQLREAQEQAHQARDAREAAALLRTATTPPAAGGGGAAAVRADPQQPSPTSGGNTPSR